MRPRWLSIVLLGAALAAFAVYHWLIVSGLQHRLEVQRAEIGTHVKRIASIDADNVKLTKVGAELKAQVARRDAELTALKQRQDKLQKDTAGAMAAAKRETLELQQRLVQLASAPAVKPASPCQSVEVKLNDYLAARLRQLQDGSLR